MENKSEVQQAKEAEHIKKLVKQKKLQKIW